MNMNMNMNDLDLTEMQPDQYTYWLMFIEEGHDDQMFVHHMIGYLTKPSNDDLKEAFDEVKNDPDFGLGDFIVNLEIKIVPAGPEINALLKLMREEK